MYTTLDTNAELQKQLGYIADDENSLKKVLAFVKELIAQQTKEHEMTKAEIMAETEADGSSDAFPASIISNGVSFPIL